MVGPAGPDRGPAGWQRRLRGVDPWLVGTVLLSVVIGSLVLLANIPGAEPGNDAGFYHAEGLFLAGHGPDPVPGYGIGTGLFVRGPVYPALLGLIYAVTGGGHLRAVAAVQTLVLLPGTAIVAYGLGRRLGGRRAARAAALAFVLWLPATFHASFVLTETLAGVLVTGATLAVVVALQDPRPSRLVVAGALVGLASFTHTSYQFFWIPAGGALAIALVSRSWRTRDPGWWRTAAARCGLVAAGVLVVLAPYQGIRAGGGYPAPGTGGYDLGAGAGWTMYAGSRPETSWRVIPDDYVLAELAFTPSGFEELRTRVASGEVSLSPELRDAIRRRAREPRKEDRHLTEADFRSAVMASYVRNLDDTPRMAATKWWRYTDPVPTYALATEVEELDRVSRPVYHLAALALLPMLALAILLARPGQRLPLIVGSAGALFQVAALLLSYPEPRYLFPFLGTLLAGAATGGVLLFDRITGRGDRPGGSRDPASCCRSAG